MMCGEKMRVRSREHPADTIDAASANSFSQRFLGEASSSAIGIVSLHLLRRPRLREL